MLIFHLGERKETWFLKSSPLSPNNYLDMSELAVDEIYCLGKIDCLQNCGEKLMSGCSYITFDYFFQDSFLGLLVFHSYPKLARSPYHGLLKTCLSCVPLLQRPLGNCLSCWLGGSWALTHLSPFSGVLNPLGFFYLDLLGHNYKCSIKQHPPYCTKFMY